MSIDYSLCLFVVFFNLAPRDMPSINCIVAFPPPIAKRYPSLETEIHSKDCFVGIEATRANESVSHTATVPSDNAVTKRVSS